MFLKRDSKTLESNKKKNDVNQCVGSEALANAQIEVNAKAFNYPSTGFVTRIEHSLLFTLVREANIYPSATVIQAIVDENYSIYFHVRPRPRTSIIEYDVSYAQLTALLALAAEEWPHDSQVPLVMCQKITHCVLRYANDKGLDRKMETDDLLQPLYKYACQREAKQSKKMLAWLIPALAGSIMVGNPLPVYAALVTSNLAYTKDIDKSNISNSNTDRIMNTGERTANVEHTSLLHEDDYDDLSI